MDLVKCPMASVTARATFRGTWHPLRPKISSFRIIPISLCFSHSSFAMEISAASYSSRRTSNDNDEGDEDDGFMEVLDNAIEKVSRNRVTNKPANSASENRPAWMPKQTVSPLPIRKLPWASGPTPPLSQSESPTDDVQSLPGGAPPPPWLESPYSLTGGNAKPNAGLKKSSEPAEPSISLPKVYKPLGKKSTNSRAASSSRNESDPSEERAPKPVRRNRFRPVHLPEPVGEADMAPMETPFEFKFSYTETPNVEPIGYRGPQFSPFGPTTMSRPWTGGAPLKKGKKNKLPRVLPEFDNFITPTGQKKGMKPVEPPGPYPQGAGPQYSRTREEILGAPLSKDEIRELLEDSWKEPRQLNLGRDGLVHNMLDNIHAHWKRRRVCRVRCKGVPTVDMDNVCKQLEDKTGGVVIFHQGGTVYLFRGRNYNYRLRPNIPLMLWKPPAPIYPRLIEDAPPGLTLEEANSMRKRGKSVKAATHLKKNGVYVDLVGIVREAFLSSDLAVVDCQGMDKSDYRKIGAKLKDLVPCVLLSFEREKILMWRGPERLKQIDVGSRDEGDPNGGASQTVEDSAAEELLRDSGREESMEATSSPSLLDVLWEKAKDDGCLEVVDGPHPQQC